MAGMMMRSLTRWRASGRLASSRLSRHVARQSLSSDQKEEASQVAGQKEEEEEESPSKLSYKGMACPIDRLYTKSHYWIKKEEEEIVRLGLSHHFLDRLGTEVIGFEASPVHTYFNKGEELGYVQTDEEPKLLRCPTSSTLIEANAEVMVNPSLLSKQPYGDGWLALLQPEGGFGDIPGTMSASEYEKFCSEAETTGDGEDEEEEGEEEEEELEEERNEENETVKTSQEEMDPKDNEKST